MSETNFGFKKVPISQKSSLVKEVFNSVASKYDIMNDFMSAGLHRRWKDKMVDEVEFTHGTEYDILDVAGGTGDIAFRMKEKAIRQNINTKIQVSDINSEMLSFGKDRAIDKNLFNDLDFRCADGENLPYEDNYFDYYTVAFGMRNFTNIENGLKEAFRTLKTGGKFICLEFSQINNLILSKFYDLYSFKAIPKIGKLVANDQDSYQYLVESIRKFPNQEKFQRMIQDVGFKNVSYKNLNFGVVAIHIGWK